MRAIASTAIHLTEFCFCCGWPNGVFALLFSCLLVRLFVLHVCMDERERAHSAENGRWGERQSEMDGELRCVRMAVIVCVHYTNVMCVFGIQFFTVLFVSIVR